MKISSRYVAVAVSLLLVASIAYYFSDIVAYVIGAWVLSLMGQPFMRFFKRHIRVGKIFQAGDTTCAILTLAAFMLIFAGLMRVLVPPVIAQARNLAEVDYAAIVEGLEEPIEDWTNWAINKGFIEGEKTLSEEELLAKDSIALVTDTLTETLATKTANNTQIIRSRTVEIDSLLMASGDTITKTNISLNILLEQNSDAKGRTVIDPTAVVKDSDNPIERIQKEIFSFFNPSQIQNLFTTIIGFFGDFMIGIFSVLFITFFFLKEQQLFVGVIMTLVPSKYGKQVDSALSGITVLLARYFDGVFIQMTVITVFVSVALSVLGIQNALLIGFFAALINVIPYVGPALGASFGIFIVISSNLGIPFYDEMVPLMLRVILVFAIMQMIDNFILQPFIFSNSVLAHPLEIFIIILVGAKLGGILGMVLAIPVYTVLRVVARVFLSEFKIVQKMTDGMEM